jgi:hypothetical protein
VLETNPERKEAQFQVTLKLAKRPREHLPTGLPLPVADKLSKWPGAATRTKPVTVACSFYLFVKPRYPPCPAIEIFIVAVSTHEEHQSVRGMPGRARLRAPSLRDASGYLGISTGTLCVERCPNKDGSCE